MAQPNDPLALEPLGVGETLDAGFRLWRTHFRTLVIVAVIIQGPIILIEALWDVSQIRSVLSDGTFFVDDVDAYNGVTALLTLVGLVFNTWVFGAILVVATKGYLGEDVVAGDAIRESGRRIPGFLGLWILYVIMVAVGLLGVIVGAIFLAVSFSLALPAYWVERVGAFAALGRSWTLVKGRRWPIFGIALATTAISFVFFLLVGVGLVGLLFASESVMLFVITNAVSSIIATIVVLPLVPVMLTATYFDSRVRNEAFDVELAARRLDDGDGDAESPPLFR